MHKDDRAGPGPSKQETLNYVLDMLKQLAALLRDCDETDMAQALQAICDAKRATSETVTEAARTWKQDRN